MELSESSHHILIHVFHHQPLLEGNLVVFAVQALRNLPKRYPGLKILQQTLYPDRVELILDFQRLDEDLSRVVQSFKSEVKNLARKKGFEGEALWQWDYEEI
jgi:hypothetical protein